MRIHEIRGHFSRKLIADIILWHEDFIHSLPNPWFMTPNPNEVWKRPIHIGGVIGFLKNHLPEIPFQPFHLGNGTPVGP